MSKFTKQHYEAIARIISQCSTTFGGRYFLMDEFSKLFKADNPRFDGDKFRVACNQDNITIIV